MAPSVAKFPRSERISDIDQDIYDIRDITPGRLRRNKDLRKVFTAPIAHLSVEFLGSNEFNTHAVFRLNFNQPLFEKRRGRKTIRCCLLSMESHWDRQGEPGAGACRIKLASYTSMTHSARAAFQFKMHKAFTLHEVIRVIKGMHKELPSEMRSNLSTFYFGLIPMPGDTGYYVGCRDWVSQVFVRLNALGWVDWNISDRSAGDVSPSQRSQVGQPARRWLLPLPLPLNSQCFGIPINWNKAGFHDVIGKFFLAPREERFLDDKDNLYIVTVVRYHQHPVERGFFSSRVTRIFRSQHQDQLIHSLPYGPERELVSG